MELAPWLGGTEALDELDAALEAAWNAVDADLLALCRDRIAMLLRHQPTVDRLTPARRATLSNWHTQRGVGDTERAALAFTEQFVVDVTAISDEQAARLRTHLGDRGLATFVNALLVIEQRMTLELGLAAVFQPTGVEPGANT